jgi:hypothetical protein
MRHVAGEAQVVKVTVCLPLCEVLSLPAIQNQMKRKEGRTTVGFASLALHEYRELFRTINCTFDRIVGLLCSVSRHLPDGVYERANASITPHFRRRQPFTYNLVLDGFCLVSHGPRSNWRRRYTPTQGAKERGRFDYSNLK